MQRSTSSRTIPPLRSAGTFAGRPRMPGPLYAGVFLVLAALLAVLAVTSRQTPPPTIAEFAPQAASRITDSVEGVVGGANGSGQTSASDGSALGQDAAQPAIDVARVRQCVGDPPRQIEDPQS